MGYCIRGGGSQQEAQGEGQGVGSEGNTKAEMGGTGGTMDGPGLRQTKLEGGWTVHKTQEDEEKKMRGQNGGEPKQMVKAGRRKEGGTERMKGAKAEKLLVTHES